MGACASKFSVLKSAADAPPPADLVSKELNLGEEVTEKTDAPAEEESKPQSLGHLFNEVKSEEVKELVVASEEVKESVADGDLQKAAQTDCASLEEKKAEIETTTKTESKEVDKKLESPEIKQIEEQKLTAPAKTAEEAKPSESVKIATLDKPVEAPANDKLAADNDVKIKTAEAPAKEKPTADNDIKIKTVEAPAKENPVADNIKIETSDKHVLEPSKTEKPSAKEPASVAEKPKATQQDK